MSNEEKILELLQGMTARLDKLEAGQTDMKTEIKDSEKRMMALMEGYFDPKFNLLADGHKLIMEQMVKKEDLEEAQEDIRTELDVLKAIVRQHSHEIAKLKKAQ